ncbi:MAG: class I SAM-dependent methyltransferase [Synergistaceae bacterium]|nr:class I SAM-dependent methyltransferase [Synergistota bacterium]NLM70522.1 class I SAM-dependent methyltransferase [Synergistaceae bacterium]
MGKDYYSEKLNANLLFQAYDTAIPQVRDYLKDEIEFVRSGLGGDEDALELGAGYGRIMKELAPSLKSITGVDLSERSVELGKEYLKDCPNCVIQTMDAHSLEFDRTFDVVLCLQNGLSAMKGDPSNLIAQSLRLLSPGGRACFSSYSPDFWDHRLAWFQEQADKGLLGEIDMEKTGDGVIVCKDGFTATTFDHAALERLGEECGRRFSVEDVGGSSIFLTIHDERSPAPR